VFDEYLLGDSHVAQRIVYDGVQAADGVTSVNVDKHTRYQDVRERKRDAGCEVEKQHAAWKRAAEHIKLLEDKTTKLVHQNSK